MDAQEPSSPSQESLLDDLRQVIENAEELLKNTGDYHGALYQAARNKLAEALQNATAELARFEDVQIDRMIELTALANRLHRDISGEAKLLRAFKRDS
ncbi:MULTISPECIES: DUF883 domain-containing protein [unclassified Duganella]|uniref:DUF883 domain-containing protein n=1 Tax=unclassified Duganella TaxID=2636909 RepID=UPI0008916D78|nr:MULTISPECIES: DUF883 domain-containing protein [unclassified Duganella]SDH31485.1 hypothetical protein SAMN05216320_11217 [Duganella sp. OV458]SDK48331.1 hypothetical protein SAMN05428973_11217 [Duganella sp. OV510]